MVSLERNEFDPDCKSVRIHVPPPLQEIEEIEM